MKTNVSKRDAIAQAMDWLGQLREDGRAGPALDASGEPATAPAATAPAVTAPLATATPPPAPATPPALATATPGPSALPVLSAPPAPGAPPGPSVSDEGDTVDSALPAERAPIGDELRIPIAWCDMGACISHYGHPAALGEADIRARAIAAGWRVDAVGRLACPQCQQSVPWFWTTQPVAVWDRGTAVTAAARLAATVRAGATGSAASGTESGQVDRI